MQNTQLNSNNSFSSIQAFNNKEIEEIPVVNELKEALQNLLGILQNEMPKQIGKSKEFTF